MTPESRIDLSAIKARTHAIKEEMSKVIVGQDNVVDLLLNALLCNGHVLLEGNPGLGKTLAAKCLAKTIDTHFSRIQFTPDLMPSDVLGTSVFNIKNNEFEFRKGPIFSNIVLIDEINRAPAKTQSSLFEVMEEHQVTIDGHTHRMTFPFLVIATQNPVDMEGTYRLPEAQLDRFLFKIDIGYPEENDEIAILLNHHTAAENMTSSSLKAVITSVELKEMQKLVNEVFIDEKLMQYIVTLIRKSRKSNDIVLGASPRSGIHLMKASKACALLNGRDFVIPEDIVSMSVPVLSHRLIMSSEKEMEGVSMIKLINALVKSVDIPR